MKKIAFAFAAAIAISPFAVSTGQAMNIGSLSRQHPTIQNMQVATLAFPAVCHDRSCGVRDRKAADYSPLFHVAFASISGFIRSHMNYALFDRGATRVQQISVASAD